MLQLARFLIFVEAICQPGRHLVVTDDVAFGRLLLHEARRRADRRRLVGPRQRFHLFDYVRNRRELACSASSSKE